MIIVSGLPQTAIDAFVYGLFGAIAGSLVTWAAAKHLLRRPWTALVDLLDRHVTAQETAAAAHLRQADALERLAGPPQPKEHS